MPVSLSVELLSGLGWVAITDGERVKVPKSVSPVMSSGAWAVEGRSRRAALKSSADRERSSQGPLMMSRLRTICRGVLNNLATVDSPRTVWSSVTRGAGAQLGPCGYITVTDPQRGR